MEINLQIEHRNQNNIQIALFLNGQNCGKLQLLQAEFQKLIDIIHQGKTPEDVFAISGLDGTQDNHIWGKALFEIDPQYTEYDWRDLR